MLPNLLNGTGRPYSSTDTETTVSTEKVIPRKKDKAALFQTCLLATIIALFTCGHVFATTVIGEQAQSVVGGWTIAHIPIALPTCFLNGVHLGEADFTMSGTQIISPTWSAIVTADDVLVCDYSYAGPDVFDDFNRSDRLLNGDVAASGHAWRLTGAGGQTGNISKGLYTASAQSFAYLPYGKSVNRIEGAFSFLSQPGSATPGWGLTIVADAIPATTDLTSAAQNSIGLNFGPGMWEVYKTVSGSWASLGKGYYNIATDGTQYSTSMSIQGNTVIVTLPDGNSYSASHPDIGIINPQSGSWVISPATGAIPGRWHTVRMTDQKAGSNPLIASVAPMRDVSHLWGNHGSKRQQFTLTPAAAGWYRIATQDTLIGAFIAGHVRMTVYDATYTQLWEFDVNAYQGSTAPRIAHLFGALSSFIDQARISSDATGVALDIHLAQSRSTTVEIETIGFFVPVVAPTVGASPLLNSALVNFSSI
jgi:hypothetical protein